MAVNNITEKWLNDLRRACAEEYHKGMTTLDKTDPNDPNYDQLKFRVFNDYTREYVKINNYEYPAQ